MRKMKVKAPIAVKRPVGRPAEDKERMSFTLDVDLAPWMEREALAAGFVMKSSGKPNVSKWLNDTLRKAEIQSRIF